MHVCACVCFVRLFGFFFLKRCYWFMFSLRSTAASRFPHREHRPNLVFPTLNLERKNYIYRCDILHLSILTFILFFMSILQNYQENFQLQCYIPKCMQFLQFSCRPVQLSVIIYEFFSHAYCCLSVVTMGTDFFHLHKLHKIILHCSSWRIGEIITPKAVYGMTLKSSFCFIQSKHAGTDISEMFTEILHSKN